MRNLVIAFGVLATVTLPSCAERKTDPARQAAVELSSRDPTVAQSSADRLADLGPLAAPAVPELAAALANSESKVRWRAARALESVGPAAAKAAPALVKALQDEDPDVRAHAAHALGHIGDKSTATIDGLAGRIADGDVRVRRAAVGALGRLQPDSKAVASLMVTALEDSDPSVVMPALQTLSEGGPNAVPALMEALQHEQGRYWATLVLAEMGPPAKAAVPELIKLLTDKDAEVRMQAILALGEIGSDAAAALPALLATLSDPAAAVRYASAYALGKIGSTEALPALEKAETDKDVFLATVAAWAIAKLKPDDKAAVGKAVDLIVSALKQDDAKVRQRAAGALLELDAPREIVGPSLLAAMDDPDPAVQDNVYSGLASLGEAAVPRLVEPLKDPSTQTKALRVLSLMGAQAKAAVPQLVEALASADAAQRRELIFALASIGPDAAEATPALVKALEDPDEDVRVAAGLALGNIGPGADAAVEELQKTLASPDHVLRLVGIEAIVRIRPNDPKTAQAAVPVLTSLVAEGKTDVTRAEAAAALGDIGAAAKSALPTLQKALTDESPEVRGAATEALQKIGK